MSKYDDFEIIEQIEKRLKKSKEISNKQLLNFLNSRYDRLIRDRDFIYKFKESSNIDENIEKFLNDTMIKITDEKNKILQLKPKLKNKIFFNVG